MQKTACPACRSKGRDNSGDNMQVYDDGHGYCHACGHWVKSVYDGEQEMEYQQQYQKKDTKEEQALKVQMIRSYPIGAPHKPWLSKDACEMYGVRYSVSESTGEPDKVYYPYYKNGEVQRYKPRTIPKSFSGIGENPSTLFGDNIMGQGGKFLVITEGEDDTLAAMTMFMQLGKKYRTVSVPNGADENGNLDKDLLKNIEKLLSFEKIVIAFDNDKPGKATAESLAEILSANAEVRIVQFPDGVKDADDMAREGRAREFMQCINDAREYTPEGIIEGKDITLESLQEESQPGYTLPYPEFQNKLHGLRKGEITLVCAGSGIGKSTLCRELGHHLVRVHDLTVSNVFLEEQHKKTAQGYIAIDNNVPLAQLRVNKGMITQGEWQKSYDELIASGKTHYFKHFGSISSDRLTNKMLYMTHGLKSDFIILDHISLVISGQESRDERKDIDILMTRLAELVNETGVGVLAVVHLKRSGGSEKGFNHGSEVSLTDLRGSSALEGLSWNVVALERDQQNEDLADMSKIRILKNREWGFTGVCDTLQYDHRTGRLLTAVREF